jgi:hypothetical protein
MAWQAMHFAVGLRRLDHNVYYFETSSSWPYDPIRNTSVNASEYALPFLVEIVNSGRIWRPLGLPAQLRR